MGFYKAAQLKSDFKQNWLFYGLVFFLLIIGLTSGMVVAKGLLPQTKLQINAYLAGGVKTLKQVNINSNQIFINSSLQNMFFFAIIISSSFLRIGFIFVLLCDFFKGLFIGFTLFFLVDTFKFFPLMGLILSVLIPFLILTGSLLKTSELCIKKSINKLFKNKDRKQLNHNDDINTNYIKKLSGIFVFILIGVLLETFFVPMIIRML